MAKEIVWDSLTPTEAKTLADLQASGKEIFAAPIEIEHREQLETLGITWSQCRTWRIGSEKVTVRLTPADEHTYKFLLGELRTKHRNAYREKRCKVPGKRPGTLIRCPECNCCSNCPFPEYRDQHEPDIISRDAMLESGYEGEGDTRMMEQLQAKLEFEDIEKLMNKENPLISQVFRLKIVDGLSAHEIADTLGIKKRNVYYYLDRAKAIGQKYNKDT